MRPLDPGQPFCPGGCLFSARGFLDAKEARENSGAACGSPPPRDRTHYLITEFLPIDPRGPQVWRTASLNLAIGRGSHGPEHGQALGPHPDLAGEVQVQSDGWIPAGPVVQEVTSSLTGGS